MTTRGVALPFEEALEGVLSGIRPLDTETIDLVHARGRALSSGVESRIALPPWDNAGMDGYAVYRDDVRGASASSPIRLPVTATVTAGASSSGIAPLRRGAAVRIMTGAPMPAGADAVVRVEDTDGGDTSVRIDADRDIGGRANVRPRGEEVAPGDVLFGPGTTIGATHLGVLASIGAVRVPVHRRPRVALVSGGDELVLLDDFAAVREGRAIVSSTTYALPALLEGAGADVRVLPLARDTRAATVRAIEDALASGIDLLVTTGGVSVGAHDHVKDAVRDLGGVVAMWRARIRPGGPIGAGRIGAVPWLGLPGNPVSTMVTGLLFASPVVRALGGHRAVHARRVRVRMEDDAVTPGRLAHFLRVRLDLGRDGTPTARLAGAQGSNLLRVLADADALLHVPEDVDVVQPGMTFDAIMLPDRAWSPFAAPGPEAG